MQKQKNRTRRILLIILGCIGITGVCVTLCFFAPAWYFAASSIYEDWQYKKSPEFKAKQCAEGFIMAYQSKDTNGLLSHLTPKAATLWKENYADFPNAEHLEVKTSVVTVNGNMAQVYIKMQRLTQPFTSCVYMRLEKEKPDGEAQWKVYSATIPNKKWQLFRYDFENPPDENDIKWREFQNGVFEIIDKIKEPKPKTDLLQELNDRIRDNYNRE